VRIVIAAVGRARKGPEQALIELYRQRLRWPMEIREVEEKRPLNSAGRKRREAALLRAVIPGDAVIAALDERGKSLGSKAFAAQLGQWQDTGRRDVAFLIGGADGLDPELRAGADLVISLGPMTWPHLLARSMLVEQLYRAECILAGHPYHRA
jgi:23S rRNA (pseudouridine1915-N3)-methyltransferase